MPEPLVIDPASSALVVIDMQNDFCDPGGFYGRVGRDVSPFNAVIAPNAAMLARAREAGLMVVFTRLVYDARRGATEERHALRPKRWRTSGRRLEPGSWGAEVVDALAPRPGEVVIDKPGYSAFEDTGLEAALRQRGVRTLLLAGVVTYACVLATAFSAFDRGFDIVMLTDLVGTWDETLGNGTYEIVDLLLGHAVPSAEIRIAVSGAARAASA